MTPYLVLPPFPSAFDQTEVQPIILAQIKRRPSQRINPAGPRDLADSLIDFPPRRPPLLASQFAYDLVLTGCFPFCFFFFFLSSIRTSLAAPYESLAIRLLPSNISNFFFLGAVHEPWSQRRWSGLSSRRRDFHHYCYHDNYHIRHPNPLNWLLSLILLPSSRLSTGHSWWFFLSSHHHASPGPLISSRLS